MSKEFPLWIIYLFKKVKGLGRRKGREKLTGPADPVWLGIERRLDRFGNESQRPEWIVEDLRAALPGKRRASVLVFEPRPSCRAPSSPTSSPRATSFSFFLTTITEQWETLVLIPNNSSTGFHLPPTRWILINSTATCCFSTSSRLLLYVANSILSWTWTPCSVVLKAQTINLLTWLGIGKYTMIFCYTPHI